MLEQKLRARLTEAIDAEDEKSKDLILGGMLQNFGEYRYACGYRKALADAKKLLEQSYEDIMKE